MLGVKHSLQQLSISTSNSISVFQNFPSVPEFSFAICKYTGCDSQFRTFFVTFLTCFEFNFEEDSSVKYCAMTETNDVESYENFVALHAAQLRDGGVSELFWKSLCTKLNQKIFDAGDYFQLLLLDYGDEDRKEKDPTFTVVSLKEIKTSDPNAIILIDHAVTFKPDIIRKQLTDNESLLNRLSIMMGLPVNDDIEKVMTNIWKFSNFYSIKGEKKK